MKSEFFSRLLQRLKPYVDRWLPGIADLHRYTRDRKALAHAVPFRTQHGFLAYHGSGDGTGVLDSEQQEFSIISRYLDQTDVFIDIGANVGLYSCFAAGRGKETIAIEPLAQNLNWLYRNLDINGFHTVQVYPVGVGDTCGITKLYGAGTGASRIPTWAGSSQNLQTLIPLVRLDVLLGERFEGKRLFIKVDVEGTELEVIKGALSTLAKKPCPSWLVEICLTEHHPNGLNPNFAATFDLFWSYGYHAWAAGCPEKTVTRSDVVRWVINRSSDCGTHNFLFSPDDSRHSHPVISSPYQRNPFS